MTRLSLLLLATAVQPALGHLNSYDTYLDGVAGPYRLSITVRNPEVIPGVVQVEVRTAAAGVKSMQIVPVPLAGPAAKFYPAPDAMTRAAQEPGLFTGTAWITASGVWRIRIAVDGDQGKGEFFVPLAAAAKRTLPMTVGLGVALGLLGLLLAVGLISIVGASVRESTVEPGLIPSRLRGVQAKIAMVVTSLFVAGAVYGGYYWWGKEAEGFERAVFKPSILSVDQPVLPERGRLLLALRNPGWFLKTDDMIEDLGHPMHLFVFSAPDMDRIWSLHPVSPMRGVFTQDLPPMPTARYRLFADVLHTYGFPETVSTEIEIKEGGITPLAGDDSAGEKRAGATDTVSPLDEGHRIVWTGDRKPVKVKEPRRFEFRFEDGDGKAVEDLELYMGMHGHAVIIRKDGQVFAHVLPTGNSAMASINLANAKASGGDSRAGQGGGQGIPGTVSFPYGVPSAGEYRIFVQMKRAGKVETGVFDFRAVD